MSKRYHWGVGLLALGVAACQPGTPIAGVSEHDETLSGGQLTVLDATSAAYSLPAPGLSQESLARHIAGDRAFEAQFVTAPAPVNPGLGPVFNNNSCIACHKADGGGRAPEEGKASTSMLFRLSVPGQSEEGGPAPIPGFGGQLQDQGIFGAAPEARARTTYAGVTGAFSDGGAYALRRPTHTLYDAYQALPADAMFAPRLTPAVFGAGLLEAVPEAAILERADEDDRDQDGISGRANRVWDVTAKAPRLGRFGWKANNPTLLQQIAGAYQQDMGITSPVFPQEASHGQPQAPASSGEVEVSDQILRDNVHYVRTLGVPARRGVTDDLVRRGAALFNQARCAACHVPVMTTGSFPEAPELSNQVIQPYTDLLLHDMGEGLADGRPDFLANGREWRTPPLWGIGLRKRVQGHEDMLHDGRARNAQEAILWHGGEAKAAKEAFRTMSKADREALLAFLASL
jgi:CxxC motif-containing protein (DUF1111 family)